MRAATRARVLERLARLCRRGVPLPAALAALSAEHRGLSHAQALAQEGATLDAILSHTPLLEPGDLELLRAGRADPGQTLTLLAEDARARAELRGTLHALLARPLWKGVVILLLALAAGCVSHATALNVTNPERFGTLSLAVLATGMWLGGALSLAAMMWVGLGSKLGRQALEAVGRRLLLASPLLGYETRARFFGVLGTSLGAGLPLAAALARVGQAFSGRTLAAQIAELELRARAGTGLSAIVRSAPFLNASSAWLVEAAVARPDLPRELCELSRSERRRLLHEAARWAPLLAAITEGLVVTVLVVVLVGSMQIGQLKGLF